MYIYICIWAAWFPCLTPIVHLMDYSHESIVLPTPLQLQTLPRSAQSQTCQSHLQAPHSQADRRNRAAMYVGVVSGGRHLHHG